MKKYLVWAGLALLLILLGGACFSLYERVTVVEEHGFRGRAAYDPFYAAELLF